MLSELLALLQVTTLRPRSAVGGPIKRHNSSHMSNRFGVVEEIRQDTIVEKEAQR